MACSEAGQHSQPASLLLVFYPLGDGVRTGLCSLTGVVLAHLYLHKIPKIIRVSHGHLKSVRKVARACGYPAAYGRSLMSNNRSEPTATSSALSIRLGSCFHSLMEEPYTSVQTRGQILFQWVR